VPDAPVPDAPVPDAPVPDAPVPPTISPTTATVAINATQVFTANETVTWAVDGIAGGDATVGTIAADGTYVAPALRPHPVTVTVTATAGGESASATVTITASPVVYVPSGSSIAVWEDADARNGNVAPTRVITGPTQVVGCVVDPKTDRLYVTDNSANLVSLFPGASTLSGAATATAMVAFDAPEGIALDSRGQLWVATDGLNDVFLYDATTLAPLRSFRDPTFTPTGERRIQLDEARDRLYLIDLDAPSIIIFDGANTLDGDATGSVVPAGVPSPWGLALDRKRDLLYVADNGSNQVAVFEGASTLTAASSPARYINVPEDAGTMSELSVDEETDRLAASTYNGVFMFDNASTADVTSTPAYSLFGAATTLGGDTYALCVDWDR
jgi:DNA-binding beta-propeller fold protein YncE